MSIYSLALRTTVTTNGAASWATLSPATNEAGLMEYGFFNGAATANVVGLGRSANVPTLTSPTLFQAEDEGRPAGLTTAGVAFGTAPTIPAQFFRRFQTAALVGAAVVFTFPRGIVLAGAGAALVTWNLAANTAVAEIYAVVDE
ncbi:MAG: hypothetical protein FJ027_19260 [Candidatus Rokubacteria bacterium]|nr:hypothetical protein [Candidatus Rokubacteria bacterium]